MTRHDILNQLLDANGISGSEDEIRKIISKAVKPYVDDIHTDTYGNLIARQKGRKPRLMIAAHMDEIGLMVKSIDDSGKIYVSPVGGIEPIVLLGERVKIRLDDSVLYGIITTKELSDDHFFDEKIPPIRDMIVDTGLTRQQLKKTGVEIGTYLDFVMKSGYLGTEDYIYGKALDDRIGCYILIELAKKLRKSRNETYFVFTVQEEVGLYGATTSAYKVEPNWAIAVDVVNANDCTEKGCTKVLGNGPTITIKDAEMITNKCLVDSIKKIAKKKKIPLQYEVSDLGTTDALSISVTKGGVPAAVVGVPVRNIHTTVGIAHKKDIENAIKLLSEVLKKPEPFIC